MKKELQKSNAKKIFSDYSPAKIKAVNSFVQIFQDEKPPLSLIKKENGLQITLDYILLWIAGFNTLIGERMNVDGMKILAQEILEKYYYFKPTDLKYCFEKLKNTKLIYCSPQEILRVFQEYDNDRCVEAQTLSQGYSNGRKGLIVDFKNQELERIKEKFRRERNKIAKKKYKKQK